MTPPGELTLCGCPHPLFLFEITHTSIVCAAVLHLSLHRHMRSLLDSEHNSCTYPERLLITLRWQLGWRRHRGDYDVHSTGPTGGRTCTHVVFPKPVSVQYGVMMALVSKLCRDRVGSDRLTGFDAHLLFDRMTMRTYLIFLWRSPFRQHRLGIYVWRIEWASDRDQRFRNRERLGCGER